MAKHELQQAKLQQIAAGKNGDCGDGGDELASVDQLVAESPRHGVGGCCVRGKSSTSAAVKPMSGAKATLHQSIGDGSQQHVASR